MSSPVGGRCPGFGQHRRRDANPYRISLCVAFDPLPTLAPGPALDAVRVDTEALSGLAICQQLAIIDSHRRQDARAGYARARGNGGVIWWKAIAIEREEEIIAVSTDAKRHVPFLSKKFNLPIAYKGTLS